MQASAPADDDKDKAIEEGMEAEVGIEPTS